MSDKDLLDALRMIADSLERIAPPATRGNDLNRGDAFVWQADSGWLEPVETVSRVHINLLRGIDRSKDILLDNTRRFANGFPANNALLWGARGTGKSSLVKAVHAQVNEEIADKLALIEIHREDLTSLPKLLGILRPQSRRCFLFCDDLSFDAADAIYKSLKAVLPAHVPIIVVGGVAPQNMEPWLQAGADGFGLGGGLYRPGQSPDETAEKARAYVASAGCG